MINVHQKTMTKKMQQSNLKTFRLFVSSTFVDFKKEREVLQREVFPEIKKYCIDNGYRFLPIDLRWGVTEEAQVDQKTIELCLEEVRECKRHPHPNFFIMTGDRYGYIPLPYKIKQEEFEILLSLLNQEDCDILQEWYRLDKNQIPPAYIIKTRYGEYLDKEKWALKSKKLKSILDKAIKEAEVQGLLTDKQLRKYKTSATEAEVKEGVLHYLRPLTFQKEQKKESQALLALDKKYVFGFIRNILNIEEKSKEFANNKKSNLFFSKKQDYEQAQKFKKNIKQTLDNSNVLEVSVEQKDPVTLDEEYLEDFKEFAYSFLKEKIDEHIKNVSQQEQEEISEYAPQEAYLQAKKDGFLGRQKELQIIDQYINNTNKTPLLLYGKSGMGKSALMAQAINIIRGKENLSQKIGYCFIGATPDTDTTKDVVLKIFSDLGINTEDLKHNQERQSFGYFAQQVWSKIIALQNYNNEYIIFIDAIDQITNQDDFSWLPATLPNNVKIIITALKDEEYPEDSKCFEILNKKIVTSVELSPFEQGVDLLKTILHKENRTIQKEQEEYFKSKYQLVQKPLYAIVAAQKMKHWKSYQTEYNLADSQQEIIREFIEDLTKYFYHHRLLVEVALAYIHFSKNGLSEDEIIDLISVNSVMLEVIAPNTHHKKEVAVLPAAIWARFYTQIKPFLGTHSQNGKNLLYLFHREFDSVVEQDQEKMLEMLNYGIYALQRLIIKYQDNDFGTNRWGELFATFVIKYRELFNNAPGWHMGCLVGYEAEDKQEIYSLQEKLIRLLVEGGNGDVSATRGQLRHEVQQTISSSSWINNFYMYCSEKAFSYAFVNSFIALEYVNFLDNLSKIMNSGISWDTDAKRTKCSVENTIMFSEMLETQENFLRNFLHQEEVAAVTASHYTFYISHLEFLSSIDLFNLIDKSKFESINIIELLLRLLKSDNMINNIKYRSRLPYLQAEVMFLEGCLLAKKNALFEALEQFKNGCNFLYKKYQDNKKAHGMYYNMYLIRLTTYFLFLKNEQLLNEHKNVRDNSFDIYHKKDVDSYDFDISSIFKIETRDNFGLDYIQEFILELNTVSKDCYKLDNKNYNLYIMSLDIYLEYLKMKKGWCFYGNKYDELEKKITNLHEERCKILKLAFKNEQNILKKAFILYNIKNSSYCRSQHGYSRCAAGINPIDQKNNFLIHYIKDTELRLKVYNGIFVEKKISINESVKIRKHIIAKGPHSLKKYYTELLYNLLIINNKNNIARYFINFIIKYRLRNRVNQWSKNRINGFEMYSGTVEKEIEKIINNY